MEIITGQSLRAASAKASVPQGNQSTLWWAWESRYGLSAPSRRLIRLQVAIHRVSPDPLISIHGCQRRHLLRAQLEVEDRQVLDHALFPHRLREHHHTFLQVPAQHNLLNALAVSLGYLSEPWQLGKLILALAQRTPGFGDDPQLLLEPAELPLLECRVELNLVDGRDNASFLQDALEVFWFKVGDTNRSC